MSLGKSTKNLNGWQKYGIKTYYLATKKTQKLYMDFKNRAKIRNLQRDHKVPQESYIQTKAGENSYILSHIGLKWRKVAEIG